MKYCIHKFKIIQIAISILLLIATSAAFADGLELTYKVEIIKENQEKNKKPIIKKSETTQDIILLPTKLSFTEDEVQNILDFQSRRLIILDHEKKIFKNYSIYADLAFNVNELSNRMMQNKMYAAMNILHEIPVLQEFESEVIFGMRVKDSSKKDIIENIDKGTHTFSYGGEVVTSFVNSKEVVPSDFRGCFNKYFMYKMGIHPDIKEKIMQQNNVPLKLSYRQLLLKKNDNLKINYYLQSSKTYHLNDIEIPSNYSQVYSDEPMLNKILSKAQDISKMPSEEYYKNEIDSLIKEKEYLDAYLALMEYSFQYNYNDYYLDKLKELRAKAGENSFLDSIHKHLGEKSKEGIEKSIKQITKLQAKKLKHFYILDVLLGNLYYDIGMRTKAIEYLSKALDHNPFLTMVYIDLGNYFYSDYGMRPAWQCFDQAVKIMPSAAKVKEIIAMQDGFRKKYPEYF